MLLNLLVDYIDNRVSFINISSEIFTINLIIGVLFGVGMVAYEWHSYRAGSGKKKQKRKSPSKPRSTSAVVNQTTLMDVFISGFLAIWCFALGLIGVFIALFILSHED